MGMPGNVLSTKPVPSTMAGPRNRRTLYNWDYEWGGIGFQDPSKGLMYQTWRAYIAGGWVWLGAENTPDFPYLEAASVSEETDCEGVSLNFSEISLTFDQNMNGTLAFMMGARSYLYWYDTVEAKMVITEIPNAISPRVSLDDKRPQGIFTSDIILAYTTAQNRLCMRLQRDRYTIEYELGFAPRPLHKIGMGVNNRMQFHFRSGC